MTAEGTPEYPPKPRWLPALTADIPRIVRNFGYLTDHRRAFAVFTHGTCVLLPNDSLDAEADAKAILRKVYNYHPDFNPRWTDDGNVLVSYSQPAYSIVFREDSEMHWDALQANYADAMATWEVLFDAKGRPNTFDDLGKIGLFGRTQMFRDGANPVVVEVWRPLG